MAAVLLLGAALVGRAEAFLASPRPASPRGLAALGGKKTVFIDGEAGTTGLQVLDRLSGHPEIDILSIDPAARKDAAARKEAINAADAVVLCLPDEAAIEAVSLVEGDVKIVDASTAYRTDPAWEYGFPELDGAQRDRIAKSSRCANPGCYPTGFIALTRPLVDAGLLSPDAKLVCSAVSGYSGGGKQLSAIYEGADPHEPWGAYGFNLAHKHLPEMAFHGRLARPPIFLPAVGDFKQGMVVSVPVFYDDLTTTSAETVHAALEAHYANSKFVTVMPFGLDGALDNDLLERGAFLEPTKLRNTNELELFVFGNDAANTLVLVARLDNLGKGASGAAVQNLNIMLGLDESLGLQL